MSRPTEIMFVASAAVDAVVPVVEPAFEPTPRLGHLVGRDARGQLEHLGEVGAVAEQAARLADPAPRPVARDGGADLLLEDPPRPAQLAQAVEVGQRRHVGIGGVPRVSAAPRLVPRVRSRPHQRQQHPAHQDLGVPALRGDADVLPCRRLRRRQGPGEERVAAIRPRRGEHLGHRPREQRLNLVLRPAHRRGRGDDLRLDDPSVHLAHRKRLDRRLVEAGHGAERSRDQVQLVLDDEVGRRERRSQPPPLPGFGGAVEPARIGAVGPAEEGAGLPHPRQRGELVDGRQLDPGNVRRHRLLHLGRAAPGGADGPAPAVLEVPLGRDAVPGGVLRRVGIVQVGDLLVPLLGVRPAQVRPRHEAVVRPHLDLGLEGVGAVGLLLVRRAPVYQEARHRARAGGQLRTVRPHRVDRALGDVKLQPPGAGDVPHDRPCGPAERERQHRLVRSPPPDRRPAAARVLDLGRRIVAPAHRDRQLTASRGNEKAQSARRREERLARRLPLVVRLLGQTRRLGNRVEVVVLVGIGAPVRRRAGRDEEAGDVPVRRALAARQLLGLQLMAGPGTDQVEPQCLDEARADLTGIGGNVLGSRHENQSGTLH